MNNNILNLIIYNNKGFLIFYKYLILFLFLNIILIKSYNFYEHFLPLFVLFPFIFIHFFYFSFSHIYSIIQIFITVQSTHELDILFICKTTNSNCGSNIYLTF